MSLQYILDIMKDILDFSFNSLLTTLSEVTLASGLLHLSIDQKCHFVLGLKRKERKKNKERKKEIPYTRACEGHRVRRWYTVLLNMRVL